MGIISCVRCLLGGTCPDPTRVPNTKCVVYQLDWTPEEKLAFLRERGAEWAGSQVRDIHRSCEEERARREGNEELCRRLMAGPLLALGWLAKRDSR
jgi:hypothetical protein